MNYTISKINKIIDELQAAYYGESTNVIDFINRFQEARDDVTRAFKNNKIDINHYLLYSNNLSQLSLNNRFRG